MLAFDHTAVVPMDFERLFAAVEDSVEKALCEKTQANETNLLERSKKAKRAGISYTTRSRKINETYKNLLKQENMKKLKGHGSRICSLKQLPPLYLPERNRTILYA